MAEKQDKKKLQNKTAKYSISTKTKQKESSPSASLSTCADSPSHSGSRGATSKHSSCHAAPSEIHLHSPTAVFGGSVSEKTSEDEPPAC